MSTYDDLMDRTYREWLTPPGKEPVLASVDGAHDNSTQTISLDTAWLAVEEERLLGPGTLIENTATQEIMRVESYSSGSATVTRGVQGTDPTAMTDGDEIKVDPDISRATLFAAIGDVVEDCSPPLWTKEDTTVIIPSTGYAEAPADFGGVIDAQYQANNRWWEPEIDARTSFPASDTGKALFIGGHAGKTVYLSYRAWVTRPNASTESLPDESWQRLLMIGAVAQIVGTVDLDALTSEYIAARLADEGVQVGSGLRLRSALMRYYEYLLEQAKARLRVEVPGGMKVTVNGKYV